MVNNVPKCTNPLNLEDFSVDGREQLSLYFSLERVLISANSSVTCRHKVWAE